ncbi:MAG: septum formation initiator family protein [Actinobacteria bacterium]|jgi:cell division protein FtsB|nr:septum formation initiator family protein [Actinomycetota bacterium]MCZ6519779.1 septum formation initiator family protein [Actinomycetota bacterium]
MTLFRRPGAALATLLFLVMGAAFLTQVVPYRQILDSQRQVSSARAQLAALEVDNELLAADIAALETDEEVEKLAREKLGYVRPGETAYVVLDPPEELTRPQPETDDLVIPEERTWVDMIWDFVTGSDLDS